MEAENSVGVSDVSSAPATDEDKIAQGWVKIDKTNFPDEHFRNFVLTGKSGDPISDSRKQIDQNGDSWLSPDEIEAVKFLDCAFRQIGDLTGIEHFTALTVLDCTGNQLAKLDVSQNKALTWLACYENQLTELDVSQNTELIQLYCQANQLKKLNVSQNKALTLLYCYSNQLTELDVSQNTALDTLWCQYNQLTELDVSQNKALKYFWCNNNQLTSLDLGNTKVSERSLETEENSYNIEVDANNRFDLRTLPGNFDVKKVTAWDGGSVDGRILTVNEGVEKVTYTYDCGTSQAGDHFSAEFTLNVTGHDASPVEPDIPADGGAAGGPADNIGGALSAVVVGAAAGAIIYEAGTGIYRVINMPGIAMPSDRIELAELLWEHAGKPEPVSTALYSDIDESDTDAQKAARWAVEQELMKDNGEKNTFNPHFPVSKLRTCLTWNAAKEKGLFDTDKTAE